MSDDIGFKIFAMIDGLKASLAEASASIKTFSAEAKTSIEGVGVAFETLNKFMLGFAAIVAGGAIFKEVIGSTVKWRDEVLGLSKQFAITIQEASGLAVALGNIGSSTDSYRDAATKLDRQVKSNEDRVNALGLVTRDANGAFLSQQQLMTNALNTLRQYKEGTDRNIASQYLLGRGAGDTAKLLRLTAEEIKEGTEDAEKFGLVLDKDSDQSIKKYKRSVNELHDAFLGFELSLGNKIIPALTGLAQVFTNYIVPAIDAAIEAEEKFNEGARIGWGLFLGQGLPKMQNPKLGHVASGDEVSQAKQYTDTLVTPPKTIDKDFEKQEENAKKATKDKIELAQLEVNTKQQLGKIELENTKEVLDAEVEAGRITVQQEIEMLRKKVDEQYKLDLQVLENQKKTDGLSVVEQQKIYDQILILKKRHDQQMNKLTAESVKADRTQFNQLFASFNQGFKQMINGILQGTQTWKQAMSNLFVYLLTSFAGFLEEKAAMWVENQLFELIFGKETAQGEALSTIAAHAAEAGSAAYAATAAIPIIGPGLAPAAGALAYAGAGAYAASVPALAVGAWEVPKDMFAFIHKGESVVPTAFAEGMRANGNVGGGGGGDVSIHLHTIDAKSGAQFLMQHSEVIAKAVKSQIRNASPHLTSMK